MNDLTGLLDHWGLVNSDWYCRSLECCDVRSLADRVCEESYRRALLVLILVLITLREASELDFLLYGRITLETLDCNKVHIIEGKLAKFRNLRLDKDSHLFRIETGRKIIKRNLYDILSDLFRIVCIVCQSLCIGDHNEYLLKLAGILKLYPSLERSHIVSKMELSGRTVTCQNYFSHIFCTVIWRYYM